MSGFASRCCPGAGLARGAGECDQHCVRRLVRWLWVPVLFSPVVEAQPAEPESWAVVAGGGVEEELATQRLVQRLKELALKLESELEEVVVEGQQRRQW